MTDNYYKIHLYIHNKSNDIYDIDLLKDLRIKWEDIDYSILRETRQICLNIDYFLYIVNIVFQYYYILDMWNRLHHRILMYIPHQGFYDYKNKNQSGLTTHVCPAELGDVNTERAKSIAEAEFDLLRMSAYGRIDMIFDGEEFWFIEANNLPGMTNTSLLPEAAAKAGIEYEDLCEMIAMKAGMKKHE